MRFSGNCKPFKPSVIPGGYVSRYILTSYCGNIARYMRIKKGKNNHMEKITCKAFKDLLWKNRTVFCDSVFRADDERIIAWLERIPVSAFTDAPRREVVHQQTNAVKFEGGSWLYFNAGEEYFKHVSAAGITYIFQRETHDGNQHYVVYAL